MVRLRHGGTKGWERDDGGDGSAELCSVKLYVYKIPCSSDMWIFCSIMDTPWLVSKSWCPVNNENGERVL